MNDSAPARRAAHAFMNMYKKITRDGWLPLRVILLNAMGRWRSLRAIVS